MSELRMSTEDMRSCADKCQHEAENVAELISVMDGVVSLLAGSWSGTAQKEFDNLYHGKLREEFQLAKEQMEKLGQALRSDADSNEELDKGNATKYSV